MDRWELYLGRSARLSGKHVSGMCNKFGICIVRVHANGKIGVLLYDLEPMSQSQSRNYGTDLRIHAHLEVKVDSDPVEVPPEGRGVENKRA